MRVDISQPLALGNFIIFQGNSNQGKTFTAMQTIKNFLQKDLENNVAIFLSLNPGEL